MYIDFYLFIYFFCDSKNVGFIHFDNGHQEKGLGSQPDCVKQTIKITSNFFFFFFFYHPPSKHRKPSRKWIIYGQECQKLQCFVCIAFCQPALEGHTGGSIYSEPCCGAEVQFIHWPLLTLGCLSRQDNAHWKLVGHLSCKAKTMASLTSAQSMVFCIRTGRHNIQITLISLSLSIILFCLIRLS